MNYKTKTIIVLLMNIGFMFIFLKFESFKIFQMVALVLSAYFLGRFHAHQLTGENKIEEKSRGVGEIPPSN
ncbi:MAG: hypothetical protein AABY22_01035 [Nanoarchaeota archaeon]